MKSCLQLGHIPIGMEMFNPADEEQWQTIIRTIHVCDYYCVIVAQRYGSTNDGMSYTEKEYEYAQATGVPILRFILNDDAPWPTTYGESTESSRHALSSFRRKLKSRLVAFWSNTNELQYKFAAALPHAIEIHPRPGWVRQDNNPEIDNATAAFVSTSNQSLQVTMPISANEHSIESKITKAMRKETIVLSFKDIGPMLSIGLPIGDAKEISPLFATSQVTIHVDDAFVLLSGLLSEYTSKKAIKQALVKRYAPSNKGMNILGMKVYSIIVHGVDRLISAFRRYGVIVGKDVARFGDELKDLGGEDYVLTETGSRVLMLLAET